MRAVFRRSSQGNPRGEGRSLTILARQGQGIRIACAKLGMQLPRASIPPDENCKCGVDFPRIVDARGLTDSLEARIAIRPLTLRAAWARARRGARAASGRRDS